MQHTWLAGGAVALLAIAGAYLQGRSDGRAICQAQIAKQAQKHQRDLEAAQGRINVLEVEYEKARAERAVETRLIRSKAVTISNAPDYARTCFDPDGVRLVNDAIASANTAHQPKPVAALP